jgi:uncharacterized caspase-like protein
MKHILKLTLAALAMLGIAFAPSAGAAPTEKRMALVIGNAAYQAGPLATPANDAGLIAQTLQAAGFDVVGARDLDEDSLRHAFRDFVDSASKAGPDAVVAIYFAGYGLQLEGENYLVPIDANIARDSDVPVRALRLSEYTHALAALHLKATIVVLDAARASPFSTMNSMANQPLAGGLALVEPEPGMLIAFNATPGSVAPEGQDGYGPYAKALAEMIREGSLPPADVFARVRLRVNEVTKGAQVPWNASKIEASFVFFERGPDAPPPAASAEQTASIRARPIHDLDARDAYLAALSRDTLGAYEDFLSAYPRDPMAKRVRALIAARREAMTWRRTYESDTPEAFWTYLRRYPRGSHAADARRRLAHLAAALEPPSGFAMIDYDVPPPPPDEVVYYERPVLIFDDPFFAFAPPPPPPVYFLEPTPPAFVVLEPPPPPYGAYILPVPIFIPVPVYVSAPAYVVAPPNPIIFNNIHNTVVINKTTNVVTITNPSGQVLPAGPNSGPPGRGAGTSALAPALPASVAPKAALINSRNPPGAGPANQGVVKLPPGQTLPTPGTGTPPAATVNKPLPVPPAATLSPPATGNKPLPIPSAATLSPPATGNKPLPNPPAATLAPPANGIKPLPIPPAATLSPPASGGKPLPNPPAATLAPPANGIKPLPIPPAATLSPPASGNKPLPNPPAATLAPPTNATKLPSSPPAGSKSASDLHLAPISPPTAVQHPVSPTPPAVRQVTPAVVHQAPATIVHQAPAAVVHQAPPPPAPVVHQAPAAAVVRQAPPPPPPPVVRQVQAPPPPPVVRQVPAPPPPHPPAPPPAAAAAAKCPIVNGKPTCK